MKQLLDIPCTDSICRNRKWDLLYNPISCNHSSVCSVPCVTLLSTWCVVRAMFYTLVTQNYTQTNKTFTLYLPLIQYCSLSLSLSLCFSDLFSALVKRSAPDCFTCGCHSVHFVSAILSVNLPLIFNRVITLPSFSSRRFTSAMQQRCYLSNTGKGHHATETELRLILLSNNSTVPQQRLHVFGVLAIWLYSLNCQSHCKCRWGEGKLFNGIEKAQGKHDNLHTLPLSAVC